MAKQYSGPIPTKLTLLANLQTFSAGDKVRFLGCVTNFDKRSAILQLEHNFPVGNGIKAAVNVQLLLGSLKAAETRIGEWVNVMGYIESNQDLQSNDRSSEATLKIPVQAIVLWSSASIQLDAYEKSLLNEEPENSSLKPT